MRQKSTFIQRVAHVFTRHAWLKLISLILAIIVWLYIREVMFLA